MIAQEYEPFQVRVPPVIQRVPAYNVLQFRKKDRRDNLNSHNPADHKKTVSSSPVILAV